MRTLVAIVLWLVCGALAVSLGGVIDKLYLSEGQAPIVLLFVLGPFGLLGSIMVFFVMFISNNDLNIVSDLYNFTYHFFQ